MESEPRIQLIHNLSIAFQAVGGKAKEVVTPCKTGDDHESCLEKQRSQNLPPWATSLRKGLAATGFKSRVSLVHRLSLTISSLFTLLASQLCIIIENCCIVLSLDNLHSNGLFIPGDSCSYRTIGRKELWISLVSILRLEIEHQKQPCTTNILHVLSENNFCRSPLELVNLASACISHQ